ncbi:MAG: dynamin [Chloroflexaceae bacterium]|nr:dynamin [Chloroflexaceae bacterium]
MFQGLFQRKRLLSERQAALLDALRANLVEVQTALERLGADVTEADRQVLRDTLEHLEELFLLVIAGEFNSGKSSFINALLGETVLAEGVTPTTDKITLLRHGDEASETLKEPFLVERTYPAAILRQLVIVDTPGTNAVIRRHEELTRRFVPRSDLVLFTTSADRPFTESEREFLELIKEWGKKIVLILNKVDILETEEDVHEVVRFVSDNARILLGTTPEVFPVSARMAQRARKADNESVRSELRGISRFDAIEDYIINTLDQETRVRLKLLSPLGVAERLTSTYLAAVEERLGVLRDDFATLDNIDQQLQIFREDLNNDVQYHLNEIDTLLRDFEQRGNQFMDDHIKLTRIPQLMQGDALKREFEQTVVGDLPQELDKRIQIMVDWSVEKNLRLWQNITDFIARRRVPEHGEQVIGQVGGAFDYNRGATLDAISNAATGVLATYDRKAEAQKLVEEIHSSLAYTAGAEVVALGVGAGLVALFTTVALDFTGILFGTVLAIGGLFILPAKKRQAKQELHQRVTEMREQIQGDIQKQFQKETDQSLERIREAISPYTRFVRGKREQLTGIQRTLSDLDVGQNKLRAEIEA